MTEHRTAEQLALTLDYLIKQGLVPGLLPKDVSMAATRLRDQEAELKTLRAALAAKDHIVEIGITEKHYRREISSKFIITDPRIYEATMIVDMAHDINANEWMEYAARHLTRSATREWEGDLSRKAYVEIRTKLQALQEQSPDRETTGISAL